MELRPMALDSHCVAVMFALPWACQSVNMVWLPLFWFVLDVLER
jgi:hypothetical protein